MNKEKGNKNADISARIAEILDYFSASKNAFALKLGYERAQTVLLRNWDIQERRQFMIYKR